MHDAVHESAAEAGRVTLTRERRERRERRRHLVRALLYGGLRPRRRGGRRAEDHHRPIVDFHGPELLFSSLGLLILCLCDAGLTLMLLAQGAREANPVMALVVGGDAVRFTLIKLALTASGLLVLVALARFTVFRVIRAATLVHVALAGYVVLVGYEAWLACYLAG